MRHKFKMLNHNLECFQNSLSEFSNYDKSKILGKGTYSNVWKAMDKRGSIQVAIKIMTEDIQNETFNDTSLREIVALKHLYPYPHIMSIKDIILFPNSINIVMPLADMTLYDLIRTEDYLNDENNFKSIAYQVIKAIAYCNSRGVMHRDIKPQNLLCFRCRDGSYRIVLTDFGLSRMNVEIVTGLTNSVYTYFYRPPEILFECPYGEKSEVWATACVLLEMFIKKPLFTNDNQLYQLNYMMRLFGSPTEKTWPMCHRFKNWDNTFSLFEKEEFTIDKFKKWISIKNNNWKDLYSLYDIFYKSFKIVPFQRCSIYDMQNHPYFNNVQYEIDNSKYYSCPKYDETSLLNKVQNLYIPYPKYEDITILTSKRRSILYEWMTEVKDVLKLRYATFFLSINLCESYIAKNIVKIGHIQIISAICMMLASRIYEIHSISSNQMISFCENIMTKEELCNLTINVLKFFEYNIFRYTIYDYLVAYCKEKRIKQPIITCAINIMIMSLHSFIQSKYSVNTVCTSALAIAHKYNNSIIPCVINEEMKSCISEIVSCYETDKDYASLYKNKNFKECEQVMICAKEFN